MATAQTLAIGLVYGNPDQPRKEFDPAKLAELAASIRENGLLQPITVRADRAGGYMIVMGERRWRASKLAGLPEIMAQVYEPDEMTDGELADRAIVENLQRSDITPLEEARAFQARLDAGLSVEELARRLGMQQAWRITERTSLLKLRPEFQDLLAKGQLTSSQAFEMSRLQHRSQDVAFRAIRTGQCPTYAAMRAVMTHLAALEQQTFMFDTNNEGPRQVAAPAATEDDIKAARGLEAKINQVGDLIAAGFHDNEVVAAKRVDPGRAATLADRLALMQKHLRQMELALRQAAVQAQMELVA